MINLIEIARIIPLVLLGCYTKEYFDIVGKKEYSEIDISKILLSTLGVTVIMYGISPMLIDKYGDNVSSIIYYVSGLCSYKLIRFLISIDIKAMLPMINNLEGEDDKNDRDNNN